MVTKVVYSSQQVATAKIIAYVKPGTQKPYLWYCQQKE